MKETIELSEEEGARLRLLAQERGDADCSGVIHEAIRHYLDAREATAAPGASDSARRRLIAALAGSLAHDGDDGLADRVRALREEAWPDRWPTPTS